MILKSYSICWNVLIVVLVVYTYHQASSYVILPIPSIPSLLSSSSSRTSGVHSSSFLHSKAPPGGLDFEVDENDINSSTTKSSSSTNSNVGTVSTSSSSSLTSSGIITPSTASTLNSSSSSTSSTINTSSPAVSTAAATTTKPKPLPFQNRGKVNEIDFCMSPSDVSLSRSYSTSTSSSSSSTSQTTTSSETGSSYSPRILSLTRALNNASNRAVRRILLSRSWPSAEALNLSLRQVLTSSKESAESTTKSDNGTARMNEESTTYNNNDNNKDNDKESKQDAKCPVPRPILNIIVRNKSNNEEITNTNTNSTSTSTSTSTSNNNQPITESKMTSSSSTVPNPLLSQKMTDEQWVNEQMKAFRETYGLLPGYEYADAYMQCILSLATSGVESERVMDVSFFSIVLCLFCFVWYYMLFCFRFVGFLFTLFLFHILKI